MRSAAGQGLFTALDPNIRAGLIPDPDAYRARFKSWLPSVTLLKLSEEDALWLGGTPRDWLAAGPSAVVITHGGDGLSAFTRDGTVYAVPGEEVAVGGEGVTWRVRQDGVAAQRRDVHAERAEQPDVAPAQQVLADPAALVDGER